MFFYSSRNNTIRSAHSREHKTVKHTTQTLISPSLSLPLSMFQGYKITLILQSPYMLNTQSLFITDWFSRTRLQQHIKKPPAAHNAAFGRLTNPSATFPDHPDLDGYTTVMAQLSDEPPA